MKILLDINHPADVHQFRNMIAGMRKRGHQFLVVARKRPGVFELLEKYGIDFVPRKGYKGILGKALGIIKIDRFLYKAARSFHPDVLVGGPGDCYITHVARLLGKPSVVFDDTEFSTFQNWLTFPFATYVCTPTCFWLNLGKKQVRYAGYHELAYLHPRYFKPQESVLKELGVNRNERFAVIRLVSWEASHDIGDHGFTNPARFVKELSKSVRVFITSEKEIPSELEKFKMRIEPDRIHDVLYYSTLFIGESSTMASEAAVLGTPAIFVSKSRRGYTNELESKYGLVFNFERQEDAMEKSMRLLARKDLKREWAAKRQRMLADKIDVTKWMTDFVEKLGRLGRKEPEVILVGQYNPFEPNMGGVEVYIQNLYEQLTRHNIPTTVFGWSQNRTGNKTFYPVVTSPRILGRTFSLALLLKSPFLPVRKNSVIIVDRPDRVLPFIFRKNRIMCVLHGSHAKNVAAKKGALLGFLYRQVERIALRRADAVVSVSHENRDYYERIYPFLKNKIRVISTGITPDFRRMDKVKLRKKYGFSANDRIVLFVGRLEMEKQVDRIIQKFNGLDAKLVIVGEGREEAKLRKAAEHLKNVVFLGTLPHEEMPEIMNCADALILFSKHEGMPSVVLEALACGIPVISSDVGDVAKVVVNGRTGYIIDDSSMQRGVKLAISNSRSMAKNCLATAGKYSWDAISQKIIELVGKNETAY